jgi:CDP-diacylglycerol--glycerol-3-phosphate 3-phosphatidyltransferase
MNQETRKIINLPNTITAMRIAAVPVLFLLLSDPSRIGSLMIAVLFSVTMLTDLLDGYVARRYNTVTSLGRFMDPIADKLLINTAMIILVSLARLEAWVAAVMIIRDLLVEGARSAAATEGKTLLVSVWGKRKTFMQSVSLTALILHYPLFGADAHLIGTLTVYLALVLSVLSGVDYLVRFYRAMLAKS